MAGDDATETNIPAVFLFGKEGGVLIGATKEKDDQLEPLRVLISNRLKTLSRQHFVLMIFDKEMVLFCLSVIYQSNLRIF